MPSGCEKCPRCEEETLQPFKGRASCLRVVDCGYSERRENDTKEALLAQELNEAREKLAAVRRYSSELWAQPHGPRQREIVRELDYILKRGE